VRDTRSRFTKVGIMNLSQHFTLQELVASQTATRFGIRNVPSAQAIANLEALCEMVLEPVRRLAGHPVYVSSGYRSDPLNIAVGGDSKSGHKKGEAADIECPAIGTQVLFDRIRSSNIQFDQLILEGGKNGWVHISYRQGRNRREILTAVFKNGKAIYSKV
jgi:zinc D-Ala-D-Ala carboxypeptidase